MHAAAILRDKYLPVPLLPGAYLVILTDDELLSIEARIAGLHLRDTLLVLGPGRRSSFGFMFRAPTDLTIAEQVLATGTGGLHIEACRILGAKGNGHWSGDDGSDATSKPGFDGGFTKGGAKSHSGRWPTNVAFIHAAGCERVGDLKVKATSIHGTSSAVRRSGVHSVAGGHQRVGTVQPVTGYADEDGSETVVAWRCASNCLAGTLDRQSGNRPSTLTGHADPLKSHDHPSDAETDSWFNRGLAKGSQVYADMGGASRFYLQFLNDAEFTDWLERLIAPEGCSIFNG
jgi:hypothetical protein